MRLWAETICQGLHPLQKRSEWNLNQGKSTLTSVFVVRLWCGAKANCAGGTDMQPNLSLPLLVRSSLSKVGKWATTTAFLSGAVADLLNPLGPFAGYIAAFTFVAAIIILVAMLLRVVTLEKGVPVIAFVLISSVVSGGIYSLQKTQAKDSGLIAGLVPAIARVQETLGIVSQQIAAVDQKVTENLAVTKDVQANTETLVQQNETLIAAVEDIASGFEKLSGLGGVIPNPERPDQFYHNARIHELGGDMLNARQSYLGFARFNVEAIDPYERFATLLKVSDGRAGAREVLGTLRDQNKTLALELTYLQLGEDGVRVPKLEAFIAANPDFAPAYLALADEFSEDRLGIRSLADKTAEANALTKFVSFEKDGGLVKFFIDQRVLAERVERAQSRLAALATIPTSVVAPDIEAMRANAMWLISVKLPEPASALSWSLTKDGPYTDTGTVNAVDPATGKAAVNPSFQLPDDIAATEIFLKYSDVRGRELGPFLIAFNPGNALAVSQQKILGQIANGWVEFIDPDKLFFTMLAVYRCGIKEARYGLNDAPVDQIFVLPPCDETNPMALPDGFLPFITVGGDIKTAKLELTYMDGTKSGVTEFRRK
jgi:hypothetical protein